MNEQANGSRPGMLGMTRALIRAPFERLQLREELARNDRLSVQAANLALEEAVRRVLPDEDELESLMLGTTGKRDLDPETSADLRTKAIEASYRNTHAVGYLRSLQRFVIGEGPTFTPQGVTQEQAQAMTDWWEQVKTVNDWDSMEDELPRRKWRDGEFFLRFFVQRRTGPPDGWQASAKALRHLAKLRVNVLQSKLKPDDQLAGMTYFRFIPPDEIADPDNVITHGILTSEQDVVTVLGYCHAPRDEHGRQKIRELIPAREVLHSKIRVDQDVKRGRSILEPVMKRLKEYEQWLGYRLVLNLVRAAVVLIKRVKSGSASQVAGIRDAQATTRETGLNDRKQRMLKPASTFVASGGIEYEFLKPDIQAQDAQHDGRAILLSAAAAGGLPEYMWTGDASNANFASTMVAESPGIREFEDWQDNLAPDYRWVYRTAMKNGAEFGPLRGVGLTPELIDELEVEVEFPAMVHRDRKAEAETDEILNRMGAKSVETIATGHGLDYDQERQRVRKEREDDIDFVLPAVVPPDADE